MNILFLCTYYHRAMIFRDCMDKLTEFGHKVKAFNAVARGAHIDDKYKDIMDDNVIHKECFSKWDRFFYFYKQKKFYDTLVSSCDLQGYDILHSHTLFNGGYVAYKIKKWFGIPYVVSVRKTDINAFLRIPFFRFISDRIIGEAAGVQFLSSPYKDLFINKYTKEAMKQSVNEKSVIITNGLEPFWLENKLKIRKLNANSPIRILCVGKIDKNKNLITTLKAIRKLIEVGYKVEFTVVGQVIDKSVFEALKNSEFTSVIEYLPKEALIEVYRSNDIYVMPSIHETFGRVYVEAMSQGLPVIYSKGQGFDGIFEDGCVGYSVPSYDYHSIAECVVRIINDYSSMSARCLQHCDEFDWNRIAKKIDLFYRQSLLREGKITK